LDPLAQLSDIHLPPAINQYPIAFGWWILVILILIVFIYSIIKLRRHIKTNKIKNMALKQLKQNPKMPVEDVLLLLKWAALAYFPRKECANLYGVKLQQFLIASLPEKAKEKQRVEFELLLQNCNNSFDDIYHKNGELLVDININILAKRWLTLALPASPKKSLTLPVDDQTPQGDIKIKSTSEKSSSTPTKLTIEAIS